MTAANVQKLRDARDGRAIDESKLRETIEAMDSLSQAGFGKIASLTKLGLIALESPSAYGSPEALATLLNTIGDIARDLESCINVEAEYVGCNFRSDQPASGKALRADAVEAAAGRIRERAARNARR